MKIKAIAGIMVTFILSFGLIGFYSCTDATIVGVQDKYLIVAADNFYDNPKLREFMNWRLNEFDVEIVNLSTILNEFPIPPTPDLLEIKELEDMNTTIPDSRQPFIEAMWIDASGKYHRFGHYKFNPYVTPPRSEYNKNEIASEPQAIFLIIRRPEVHEGDEINLTYDGGNTKVISLPKMRESYTRWTKLYITIDEIPFFEKEEAHSIHDYIKNVYESESGKLKYGLLVGDVDLLPAFNVMDKWWHTPPTTVTDHFFSCIDDNDYAPELAIGRLPANDATELEVMIDKTMNYRSITLNKFLLMEGFDAGEIGDLEYETTRSVIINSLQSWLENPNITELRKKNGDLTKSNIINVINSAQDFIIYFGHGTQTCWHNLCTSDMVSLNNETPSIVFAFTCLSGDYGYLYGDCMGEAFLKDEDSGVTGYFGSCATTNAGSTNRLAEYLFQIIPYSSTIGEAINKTKEESAKRYHFSPTWRYNLLGDPALNLLIPEYTLTIYSLPTGVTFTVDVISRTAPWSGTYIEGTSVSLVMPEIHTVDEAKYYWNQWSDGNTSRSRTVAMNANITLTAYYTGPYYQLTVTSSPITGITFTINDAPQTTPYTEWLLESSYTLVMPETHDGYVWSYWLEDGDTNRIKTVTMDTNITLTAVFTPDTTPPSISIVSPENKTYPVEDVPLTFTVSESTSWMAYSLDGQANVTITGNTTLSGLLDGSHYVVVYANDTAGNMGTSSTVYFTVDTTPPNIIDVSQTPLEDNVLPEDEVKVNATVTDELSGVKQVSLNYTNGNGTWITVNMTNLEGNVWNATIPAFPYGTNVTYTIIAEDNMNNTITTEDLGYEYQYTVIPEFPSWTSMLLILIMLTVAIAIHKRRLIKTPIH